MSAQDVRPSRSQRLVTFYHEVIQEMKKVTWPDRPQVRQLAITVIVFTLLIGAVIGVMDVILQTLLVRAIPSIFGG